MSKLYNVSRIGVVLIVLGACLVAPPAILTLPLAYWLNEKAIKEYKKYE